MNLLNKLREEKQMKLKGGLYHQTQIKLCYNSNRIEGSRLSEEQTRYIFETNTLNVENGGTANVDDILETVNHFACFDYMLDIADKDLAEDLIKEFHRILKSGTSDAKKDWFKVGDYKTQPNIVGGVETAPPKQAPDDMADLLKKYNQEKQLTLEDIITFHYKFERIHPFQDGNGRVGRLIMFKECLKNNILPFIIEDEKKLFYYRGLKEFTDTQGYLMDTCRAAQDTYKKLVEYFEQA
ncbi:MAG: Fic family protein [Candidatus Margulisbacteria bacterium]|jgi:Fic family protein|nr:Fic family protein [Candidatus Margulisiibacteriota bacterium]